MSHKQSTQRGRARPLAGYLVLMLFRSAYALKASFPATQEGRDQAIRIADKEARDFAGVIDHGEPNPTIQVRVYKFHGSHFEVIHVAMPEGQASRWISWPYN